MNTEFGIVATDEIETAAEKAQRTHADLENLRSQTEEQQARVSELYRELQNLVSERRWDTASTSDDTTAARNECLDVLSELESEEGLLNAMKAALKNTESQACSAGERVVALISQFVSNEVNRSAEVAA